MKENVDSNPQWWRTALYWIRSLFATPERKPVPHPEHSVMESPFDGYWRVAKPMRASFWIQRKLERQCREQGGHWWHADPAGMIDWFCCQCGAETDGMPKDGE